MARSAPIKSEQSNDNDSTKLVAIAPFNQIEDDMQLPSSPSEMVRKRRLSELSTTSYIDPTKQHGDGQVKSALLKLIVNSDLISKHNHQNPSATDLLEASHLGRRSRHGYPQSTGGFYGRQ